MSSTIREQCSTDHDKPMDSKTKQVVMLGCLLTATSGDYHSVLML